MGREGSARLGEQMSPEGEDEVQGNRGSGGDTGWVTGLSAKQEARAPTQRPGRQREQAGSPPRLSLLASRTDAG